MVLQGTATSRLNEAKYKVLHLDCGNPHYQYKLRDERLESWKKKQKNKQTDLGVLLDGKLDKSQHCTLAAQKASYTLGCIKRRMASRVREAILPTGNRTKTWPTTSLHPLILSRNNSP